MKKLLAYILAQYGDQPLEILKKVRVLTLINLIIPLVWLPYLIISQSLDFQPVTFAQLSVSILVLLFSLYLLSKGRFRIASTLTLLTCWLTVSSPMFFSDFDTIYQISGYAFISMLIFLLVCVLNYHQWQIFLVYALTMLAIVGLFVFRYLPLVDSGVIPAAERSSDIEAFVTILFGTSVALWLVWLAISNSRSTIRLAEEEVQKNRERSQTLEQILLKLRGNIETGETLYQFVTETSTSTEEIVRTLGSNKQTMDTLNSEIHNSVERISQIARSTEEMTVLIENQSGALSESSASIEEILASIKNIAGIVETKRNLADNLFTTAKNGLEKMEEAMGSVNKVTSFINDMQEIILTINEIAEQTDILSMNAAIEAAHAGEAGRGFAVVAEEIRKLSDDTKANSREISTSLETIIEDITQADALNQASGNSFKELVAGIKDIVAAIMETSAGMNQLNATSSEVMKALRSLFEITDEIRQGTSGINANAAAIDEFIVHISSISEQTLAGMQEISQGVSRINTVVSGLQEMGKANEENIVTLEKELSGLKGFW